VNTGKPSGAHYYTVVSWAPASILAGLLVVMVVASGIAQESTARAPIRNLFGAIFDPDTGPTFNIGGEISGDIGFAHDDVSLSYDTVALRRAKLGIEGRIVRRLSYRIIGDLSGDTIGLAEGYIAFRHEWETGRALQIQVGHFKPPNTLEFLSSGRFVSFMERSASSQAFGFARQYGVGVDYTIGNVGLSAGVFSYSTDVERKEGGGRNISIRGYRTVRVDNALRHVGVSLRFRDAGNEAPYQYSARLPLRLANDSFINTGEVGDHDRFAGGELLYANDSYHVFVELGVVGVELADPRGNANFWGVNAEVGYWLTGELAADAFGGGRWQRPGFKTAMMGNNGWGAVQVVAGVDFADLSDGSIAGGRQLSLKAGANWWPRENVRMSTNMAYSIVRDSNFTAVAGPDGKNNIFLLGVRAQFDF